MKSLKLLTAITVLLGLACAEIAVAHEQAGAMGRKNLRAGGGDILNVECFDDGNGAPDHLYVDIKDVRPLNPATVSVQVIMPSAGAVSEITTDPVDGDSLASPGLKIVGGAGVYQINVTKSRSKKKGVEIYLLNYHCETASGVHTGTGEASFLLNN